MDASLKKMAKEIVKVTSKAGNSPQPYDTSGIVKRIEGGTAYVIFDGADEETPVSMTINCMPGDNVKIRVSDRKAWVTGNATAPPTDNRVAYRAINIAEHATEEADIVYKKAIDGEFNGTNGKDGERGLDGDPGADAPLVTAIIQYWCLWNSRSLAPDNTVTWYDYIPEYESGKYYWTKTVTIYDDNTTVETDPVFDMSLQAGVEASAAGAAASQAAIQARNAASASASSAQTASTVAEAVSTELDNLESHFWYDDTGAHVSENEGSIAAGYAFNSTSTNATITKNGKKRVELDSTRLNFYDPNNSGNTDLLMASYNNNGAILYSNGIRSSTFTSTYATFWDATDLQNAGTSNQRRFAEFGGSSCNFYSAGNLASSFGSEAINFYDQRNNVDIQYTKLASYTRAGINLYTQNSTTNPTTNNSRVVSFTPSALTFWDPSDTAGNDTNNQRKEAIFGASGADFYAAGNRRLSVSSAGMKIYHSDGQTVLNDVNSDGMYIYNSSGTQLGYFSTDGVQIGKTESLSLNWFFGSSTAQLRRGTNTYFTMGVSTPQFLIPITELQSTGTLRISSGANSSTNTSQTFQSNGINTIIVNAEEDTPLVEWDYHDDFFHVMTHDISNGNKYGFLSVTPNKMYYETEKCAGNEAWICVGSEESDIRDVRLGAGSGKQRHGVYCSELSNWMIYTSSESSYVYLPIAGGTTITSSATAAYLNSSGRLSRSSSSKRYKHDISNLTESDLDPNKLYNLRVAQFKYNEDIAPSDDYMYEKFAPGFIAEEVEEIYPIAAIKDADNNYRVEDWDARYIIPPMLALIQNQKKMIDRLNDRITALESA